MSSWRTPPRFRCSYRGQSDYVVDGRRVTLFVTSRETEYMSCVWRTTWVAKDEADGEVAEYVVAERRKVLPNDQMRVIVDFDLWHLGYYGTRVQEAAPGVFYDEELVEELRRELFAAWPVEVAA